MLLKDLECIIKLINNNVDAPKKDLNKSSRRRYFESFTHDFDKISLNFLSPQEILKSVSLMEYNVPKEFSLDDEDNGYYYKSLIYSVPEYFYTHGQTPTNYFFGFYSGDFFKVSNLETKVCIERLKDAPEDESVVDFNRQSVYDTVEYIGSDLLKIRAAYEKYLASMKYIPSRYEKIVEKPVKVPDADLYDPDYSMTREESDKLHEWVTKHNEEVHDNKFRYTGAIGVSRYKIDMGWTSIGSYITCRCTDCMRSAKEAVDSATKDRLTKLGTFEVRELG